MSSTIADSVSVEAVFDQEATPDSTLIRLYFTGEGITLEDSAAAAQRKASEAIAAIRANHPSIQQIDAVDVTFGQKEDRIRQESQAFPRPLAVQGVLIITSPADTVAHYRIVDDGIRRGALLEHPQNRSFFSDMLNNPILYGLIASGKYESMAVEGCLKAATERARVIAACAGKRPGKLISVSGGSVEPGSGEPLERDYSSICRSLPTRFLSPSPHKVVLSAKLTATFALRDES